MEAQIFNGPKMEEIKDFFQQREVLFGGSSKEKTEELNRKAFGFLARGKNPKDPEEFYILGFSGKDILNMSFNGTGITFYLSDILVMKTDMVKNQKGYPPDFNCRATGVRMGDVIVSVREINEKLFGILKIK